MMRNLLDLLSAEGAYRFGWALLHSFWQSAVVLIAVFFCLRLIPANRSQLRYAVTCVGLFMVVCASLITFLSIGDDTAPQHVDGIASYRSISFSTHADEGTSATWRTFSDVPMLIRGYMPWMLTAWMAGFVFFVFRFIAGLFYNQRIISTAVPLDNEWTLYIKEIAALLGIRRPVRLAQSFAVSAPIVIGYVKPIILIPVGMLTGLNPEQLQTVFLHELAHIRRHDYLINILQSTVEVVFFFNPFVWTLSRLIRQEREYCCDDFVVRQHGNAAVYAHALTQLAENSLSARGLALSIAGANNHLLNRIRRIMEKSVGNYSGKARLIVPGVLLLAGLFCISWLGIQQDSRQGAADQKAADTVIQKKNEGARYSRKSIITLDENGQPHEEIIEEFEGDETLRPLLHKRFESMSDLPGLMAPLPPLVPGAPTDTIPPAPFDFRDAEQWDEFSKRFNEKFGEDFHEMLAEKEKEVAALMRELEEKFQSEEWVRQFEFNFPQRTFDSLDHFFDENTLRRLEEEIRHLHDLNLERVEGWRDHFDGNRYEDVLQKQLRKDGYLSEDETINSLEWNDETLKVNGKKIKEADEEKYREINREYFSRRVPAKAE